MNDKFNEQKDTLVSLKHEISLLQQQVDYLLRNEKTLGLLDLDVMMNRTHSIYDQLCSIDISDMPVEEDVNDDDEELPVDEETVMSLFGIEKEKEEAPEEKVIPEEAPQEEEEIVLQEEEVIVPQEEEVIPQEEEPVEEEEVPEIEESVPEEVIAEAPRDVEPEAPIEKEEPAPDDFGFILNFEPMEAAQEEPQEESPEESEEEAKPVYTTGDEIEMSIPQFQNTEEEPHDVEEIPYEPVIIGDMEEKEESGFELEAQETLGERLQQQEDHSLAARLQHEAALKDLRTTIGINDKFLLVNELFGGSMEKYNKSIENLNDLKTLNGALIYMNELRIELQWNSSNEAYKKLLELVHRKFEA